MKRDDYYQRLGVQRTASVDALRRAFRDQMLTVHPDHNPDSELACQKTREIVEAYKTLRDPQARRRYDLSNSVPVTSQVVYCSPGFMETNRYLGRVILLVAFVLFSLAVSIVVRAISESHGSAFKVALVEQSFVQVPTSHSVVIKPSVTEPVEWCYCQELELSALNSYLSDKLLNAYTQAAERAWKNGDTNRLAYYRECIERANSVARGGALQNCIL